MKKLIVISFMLLSVLFAVKDSHHAAAKPISDEVEICHRTHSVEKPYVRIIVAQSSIGSGHGKHGGESHDDYSEKLFPDGKPFPNVFNLKMVYGPASEKLWGDIIPLTDVSGNKLSDEAADAAGLNYSGIGIDIYEQIDDYAGLCASSSTDDSCLDDDEKAKTFGELTQDESDFHEEEECEVENSTTTTSTVADSTTTTSTVPDSTTTTSTTPDSTTTTSTVVDSTTTSSTVAIFATTTTIVSSSTTAPANSPTTSSPPIAPPSSAVKEPVLEIRGRLNGRLKGHLWIDDNRNEVAETGEDPISQALITVYAAPGNSSTGTHFATPNEAGDYLVDNIEEGKWLVQASILVDGEYENVPLRRFVKAFGPDFLAVNVVSGEVAEADFAYVRKASARSKIVRVVGTEPQVDALPITGTGNSRSLLVLAVLLMMMGSIVIKRDVK